MASSCSRRDSGLTLGKNFFTEIGMTLERPAQASGGAPIPGSVQEMTTQGTLCYSSVDMMLFSQSDQVVCDYIQEIKNYKKVITIASDYTNTVTFFLMSTKAYPAHHIWEPYPVEFEAEDIEPLSGYASLRSGKQWKFYSYGHLIRLKEANAESDDLEVVLDVSEVYKSVIALPRFQASNMDCGIECTHSEFANTNLCGAAGMLKGKGGIQRDLDRLGKCLFANLMKFHKAKCKTLQLGQGNPKHRLKLGRE
ncbi:hypothetical protein HGM15179_014222 [Zosterops borbonicus]|uniref:Uncharacterized protein n=1 Tax=Zosterops borbonicus TaxID=364589 RepID=A0A8K1LGG6_9PASS|nr:hypothetical protein HGM15179_014222 [Zosterops borbonicus]